MSNLVRRALLLIGAGLLVLAAGFVLGSGWVIWLWPLPDGRLSYAFIAAILAGSAAPLIWISLSGELSALASYGLSFAVVYGGVGLYALRLGVGQFFAPRPGLTALALLGLAGLALAAAAACGLAWLLARRLSSADPRRSPRLVRLSFGIEVLVLAGVGVGLVLQIPHVLPWPLSGESSVMYGWVFLGLALYYAMALRRPLWIVALGPLLGFLAYDVVLFGPLAARYGSALPPEFVLGQVAATAIILYSTGLGVYYLLLDPRTRLWPAGRAHAGGEGVLA